MKECDDGDDDDDDDNGDELLRTVLAGDQWDEPDKSYMLIVCRQCFLLVPAVVLVEENLELYLFCH